MKRAGFTLIEMSLALFAGAILLAAIYGLFSRAVHLRNNAFERMRLTRERARAAAMLRDDLRAAIVTGEEGGLATVLEGSQQAPSSSFPGYLKFSTATAREDSNGVGGDVQQVEYFVANDTGPGATSQAGTLVRTVDRDPLSTMQNDPPLQPVLSGVTGMDLSFWDGTEWTSTWEYSEDDNPSLPEAVKVVVHLTPPALPIEVEAQWEARPQNEASPAESSL